MDQQTRERFAAIDEHIAEVEARLVTISRQNSALAEMVEVLGGYVNTALDRVQQHIADEHA